MSEKLQNIVKAVYSWWRRGSAADTRHPDDEAIACFVEGKLNHDEAQMVKEHAVRCAVCAGRIALGVAYQEIQEQDIPQDLIEKAVASCGQVRMMPVEIVLRMRDKVFEVISSVGDIIVGQELIPASVLRSRNIAEFRNEVVILKDFDGLRAEISIRSAQAGAFNVKVGAKDIATQKPVTDLRIALIKDQRELESYAAETGSAVFENISPGRYGIELRVLDAVLAALVIDVTAQK